MAHHCRNKYTDPPNIQTSCPIPPFNPYSAKLNKVAELKVLFLSVIYLTKQSLERELEHNLKEKLSVKIDYLIHLHPTTKKHRIIAE